MARIAPAWGVLSARAKPKWPTLSERPSLFRGCFRHPYMFVRSAVVKEPPPALSHHALNKHYVRHLPDPLPFFFRGEDGLIGSQDEFAGILAIEDRDAGAIHKFVVGAVVDQDDAARCEDRWRTGLDHARIKFFRAARQHRRGGRFRPVNQIGGIRQAHLVGLVRGSTKPVHPILAVDFFGHDGPGLGPGHIPVSFVGGQDHALAVPMDQIAGSGEAELRILFVIAGVGEVKSVAEFLEAWVFDATIFFIFIAGFWREDWIGAAREANPISTLGITEARGTRSVLR